MEKTKTIEARHDSTILTNEDLDSYTPFKIEIEITPIRTKDDDEPVMTNEDLDNYDFLEIKPVRIRNEPGIMRIRPRRNSRTLWNPSGYVRNDIPTKKYNGKVIDGEVRNKYTGCWDNTCGYTVRVARSSAFEAKPAGFMQRAWGFLNKKLF